jgi:anaerobic selenocysteine-containing dehydrogenase
VNNTDLLLVMGWNGMQSHQIPQAPRQLQRLAKDPDKMLIVVDPRLTETARIADIHLPIRPGTATLLLKSMIAIILKEGWDNKFYLENRTSGFDKVKIGDQIFYKMRGIMIEVRNASKMYQQGMQETYALR